MPTDASAHVCVVHLLRARAWFCACVHVRMFVCAYACVCACVYACVYARVRVYVPVCACVPVFTSVCVHVCDVRVNVCVRFTCVREHAVGLLRAQGQQLGCRI